MLASHNHVDEVPVINMTPMVDIILCLLVFFMAATRLYDWDESEFVVHVPEVAEAAPLTAAPDDLILTVMKRGVITVGETSYNLDQLVTLLRDARERYANQGVVIRGDATLTYQGLADVLSTCDEAGIRNVRLPVSNPRPRSPQSLITRVPFASVLVSIVPTPPRRPCSSLGVPLVPPEQRMASIQQMLQTVIQFVQSVMHLDPVTLNQYADSFGPWLYVGLFGIIFAETGLVVTPFLPGDSLLFAIGAVAAHPHSPIQLGLIAVLLVIAAVLGDAVNYMIGYVVGPRVFSRDNSWLLNKKHLLRAITFTRNTAESRSSWRGSSRSSGPLLRSSLGSAK